MFFQYFIIESVTGLSRISSPTTATFRVALVNHNSPRKFGIPGYSFVPNNIVSPSIHQTRCLAFSFRQCEICNVIAADNPGCYWSVLEFSNILLTTSGKNHRIRQRTKTLVPIIAHQHQIRFRDH